MIRLSSDAFKAHPGEIRSLELQLKMLREKRDFLPRQIEVLRHELQNLPSQIASIERQIDSLKRK